jgi:hypothetical protein
VRDAEAATQQYYSHNSPHLLVKGGSCVKSTWVNQQGMDYIRVDDHVKRTHPGSGRKRE